MLWCLLFGFEVRLSLGDWYVVGGVWLVGEIYFGILRVFYGFGVFFCVLGF